MTYRSERYSSVAIFDTIDYSEFSDPQRPESFQLPAQNLAQSRVLPEKFGRLHNTPIGYTVKFAQILEITCSQDEAITFLLF